jgi:hypothetical protein
VTETNRPGRAARLCFTLLLPLFTTAAYAVDIDGNIGTEEWSGAQHITGFVTTQPLTGKAPTYATEAWILSTPDGLAIAFRNTQPASVPRTLQRVQRDFDEQVDRVNIMIDFDADSRTAYDFCVSSTDGIYDGVVTDEKQFNPDWDSDWRHAVSMGDDGWTAEVLIPWHIAPMHATSGDKRTLRVYLDRVVGSTGERFSWPNASLERSRFVSDFSPLEVQSYNQSLFAVTPYVSGLYDNVRSDGKADAGADLIWKPNGQVQLTATLNPDFGQVESDDLVVNFDATETFISDKRPFFTENQGLFEFSTPSDFSQLLYTRRIGAAADDGSGAGDILGAVKLNGSLGDTKYGLFAADEAHEAGREFAAVRLVRDYDKQNLGLMATYVDHPYLDRQATVAGLDHNWRPTPRWNIRTRVFGSDIKDAVEGDSRDTGATLWADYEMDHGWRQQLIAMHFGNDLEINDAGYLSRASTNYLHYQVNRRFTDLPADSRYASKDWRVRGSSDYNDHGDLLRHQLRISRESRLRNGSYEFAQINIESAGTEDLLTRGHGNLKMPPRFTSYFEFDRPRKGRWGFHFESDAYSGGLRGNHALSYDVKLQPNYFVSDAFSINLGVYAARSPHWLVWQQDNLVGEFGGHEAHFDAGFTWIMSSRHELRMKLQAIGIDAALNQAYRVDAAGNANASTDPVDDFNVRKLGFQLRYRYEMAPLSYLYVVYARGGFDSESVSRDTTSLIGDAFSLRDDEQLLVKFSYRFASH